MQNLLNFLETSYTAYQAVENAKATDKLDVVGIFGGSDSYLESTVPPYMPKTAGELRPHGPWQQKLRSAPPHPADQLRAEHEA